MFRFFFIILYLFFLANHLYAAREKTGYNRGVNNKNFSVINELLDKKNYQKSIELLKKEIRKDKLNADLYNYLGYAYRKNGNLVASIQSYKEALRLNPSHAEAHNYIGIAYLKKGNVDQAKFHLKKIKEICKGKCAEYKNLKKEINKTLELKQLNA